MKESGNVSIRPTRNEWKYLNNHNYKPSDYWHKSIKRDIELESRNILKNRFQNYTYSMVMMAIGAMFWFFITTMHNLAGIIIVFLIGLFLIVTGGVTLILEVKKK